MSATSLDHVVPARSSIRLPLWLWAGILVCALLVLRGNALLRDADTFWQIKVGKWILDHHALPHTDTFSFTMNGQPWLSSSWLSQLLFAKAYDVGGWAAVVLLSSLAVSITLAFVVRVLDRHFKMVYSVFAAIVTFALCADHLFARPHVLAMPILVAWFAGLVAASEQRRMPSFWLLPLMALWANLHGGFVMGLGLVGLVALDALWNAEPSQRKSLALRWILFGICSVIAACVTPYGWNSFFAAGKIVGLGDALTLLGEWRPADFSKLDLFEACLLAALGAALLSGVKLSPTRILLILCLLHMALSHVRNIDTLVLLLPIILAEPLSAKFGGHRDAAPSAMCSRGAVALAVMIFLGIATAVASLQKYQTASQVTPEAAVAALKAKRSERVFNEYGFGGYLVWNGIPVFVDGRAELYGEKFILEYFNGVTMRSPGTLIKLLDTHRIDATLLSPSLPAVFLLDRLDGWQRIHSDEVAVVHVRKPLPVELPR